MATAPGRSSIPAPTLPLPPVPTPTPNTHMQAPHTERGGTNPDTPNLNSSPAPPPPHLTAKEKEIRKSFLEGSMTSEVEDKLKTSSQLRRSVLGIPRVSLQAQEVVVKGRMSSELRSLMINDLNPFKKPQPAKAEGATVQGNLKSSVATTAKQALPPSPMGKWLSKELRDDLQKCDEAIMNGSDWRRTETETTSSTSKVGGQGGSHPPKKVLTAKRSNRPERPVPSTSTSTVTGNFNRFHLAGNTEPTLKAKTPRETGSIISPEPARVVSDIATSSSDQDTPSMRSISNMLGQGSSGMRGDTKNRESTTNLKRKRDSPRASTGERISQLRTSHSELEQPSSRSRRVMSLSTPTHESSSRTTAAEKSSMSHTNDSKRRRSSNHSSNGYLLRTTASAVHNMPAQEKHQFGRAPPNDVSMDDFNKMTQDQFHISSDSSDEDYAMDYGDDSEDGSEDGSEDDSDDDSDEGSDSPGNEDVPNEEPMEEQESTSKRVASHDYTLWKLAPGKTVRTAGALLPPEYRNYHDPDYPWICPVRSCRTLIPTLTGLGGHFNRGHARTKLNDNQDGTLSIVGRQGDGNGKPAIIVSRRPLDPNEPPMAQPTVPSQLRHKLEQRTSKGSKLRSDSPNSSEYALVEKAAPNTGGHNPGGLDLGANEMALWKYIHPFLKNTPFSQIPQRGHVREFLSLPRVRDVKFNKTAPHPFSEKRAVDIAAMIMQVTGEKPAHPCSRCQVGKGPFEGCYVISTKASLARRQTVTGCANCYYKHNQTYCDLKEWSREKYPELAEPVDGEQVPTRTPVQKESKGPSDNVYWARRSERIVVKESIAEPAPPSNHLTAKTETPVDEVEHPTTSLQTSRSRVQERSDNRDVTQGEMTRFTTIQESAADPAQQLEVETWEIAPGRVRNKDNENVIFSTAYLSQGQAVPVGRNLAFQVIVIKPGTMHTWETTEHKLRLCGVATGKVKVKLDGEETAVGPNGMFKILPGVKCTAMNPLYVDVTLQVTVLPGDLL